MDTKKVIGYKLKDIVLENSKNPRHFLKPTDEEIRNLKIGDEVKLIFELSEQMKDGCMAERMWVIIDSIKENKFTGTLDNSPYYITTIKAGDKIEFLDRNIATVIIAPPNIDFEKFAVISKRAIEKHEINWVVRTDDLCDEQDSGWQLFYGDEDDEYLDNYKNGLLILLVEALQREPLLEKVFIEKGYAYEYDEKSHSFVKADN